MTSARNAWQKTRFAKEKWLQCTSCEIRLANGTTEGQVQTQRKMPVKRNWRPFSRINKDLLVFKLYYFFSSTAKACVIPFLPVFFRHVGMSAEQTGFILGLQPLARLIGAPLCGGLADKFRKHRVAMMAMCITSSLLLFSLVFVRPSTDSQESNLCSNGWRWNISKGEYFSGKIWPRSGFNCSLIESKIYQNCGNNSALNQSEITDNKKLNSAGKARDDDTTFILMSLIFFMSSFFKSFDSLADAATVKYLTAIDMVQTTFHVGY